MPIPKPKKGEKRSDFVSRCMGDSVMVKDYPQEQRAGVCYTSWKDSKGANNDMDFFSANVSTDEIRNERLNDRDYVVAPVVMAVEGVMNDLLYPAEELGKFVEAWNGRPVTLFHPRNSDGFISANSPEVAASVHLGILYNSKFVENSLKSEIWVDTDKTKTVRPEILEFLEGKKDRLEVSTGLFGDVTPTRGTWNGKQYEGIMRNIRPDHLALLPGGEGACNWRDGCGVRANCSGCSGSSVSSPTESISDEHQNNGCPCKNKKEEAANNDMKKNKPLIVFVGNSELSPWENGAMTDSELRNALQRAVDALDNTEFVNYVEAIIPDENKVIYRTDPRSTGGPMMMSGKMFRRGYTVDQNGIATFVGEPEEVRRKIEYLKVQEKGEGTVKKDEMVEVLIKDPRTKFDEGCKEFLNGLNEKQLEKLIPEDNVIIVSAKLPGATDVATLQAEADKIFEQAINPNKKEEKKDDKPKTNETKTLEDPVEWLNSQQSMPKQMKAMFANLLVNEESKRIGLIENISKSPVNKFSKEKLQAMETADLEYLDELVNKPETNNNQSNFGMRMPGGATPQANEDKGPEPLIINSMEEAMKARNKK